MSLTALPSELIFEIADLISRTAPRDIEDFGRSCRRVRGATIPLIKEHRRLLRQYTKLNVNNAEAAKFLYEIAKRPWVAFYPHTVEVSANRNWRTFEKTGLRKQINIVEDVKRKRATVDDEDLETVILRTGFIPIQDVHVWMRAIDNGDEDYLFALLLASLPNLNRFTIRLDSNKMEQVKDMLRAIKTEWSRRPTWSNLRIVEVISREGASECDLEAFPLFAAIPGVQDLRGSNLIGMYRTCYRDGWLSYPGASSSITKISLEACGMSVEGLETLMKSLHRLKHFRYVAHRAGWGAHSVSSFLKTAHDTLETLELSAGAGSSRYVGSLRAFTALQHVTLDTDMLLKNGKMQRFVDLMPASITTCTLAGNNLTKPMADLFLAELFRPSFHYPNLKSIFAEDSWGKRNIGQERLKFQKEFHKQTTWMQRYR